MLNAGHGHALLGARGHQDGRVEGAVLLRAEHLLALIEQDGDVERVAHEEVVDRDALGQLADDGARDGRLGEGEEAQPALVAVQRKTARPSTTSGSPTAMANERSARFESVIVGMAPPVSVVRRGRRVAAGPDIGPACQGAPPPFSPTPSSRATLIHESSTVHRLFRHRSVLLCHARRRHDRLMPYPWPSLGAFLEEMGRARARAVRPDATRSGADDGRVYRYDERRLVVSDSSAEEVPATLPSRREWLLLGGYGAGDLMGEPSTGEDLAF